LIHDIGKLAVFMTRPEEYLKIQDQKDASGYLSTRKIELKQLGIDHCEIGFQLLTRWMFPEQLIEVVAFHHHPEKCTNSVLYTTIIQISDLLSILVVNEEEQDAELYPQFTTLLPGGKILWQEQKLSINEEKLQEWRLALLASIEKDSAILNIFTS
ncbi:MAG: hypothetical protein DSY80_00015, partial [Desulfocapsa sp.]